MDHLPSPRKVLEAFKKWDKDGNGFITKDELADVRLDGGKEGDAGGREQWDWPGIVFLPLPWQNLRHQL